MPYYGNNTDYETLASKRQEITRQLRAKFPSLMEGSAGWNRAYANRMKRWRAV